MSGPFRTLSSGLEPLGRVGGHPSIGPTRVEVPQALPADQRTQRPSHASPAAISSSITPICELRQTQTTGALLKFNSTASILNLEDCR
jgi:hypothetical protein